MIDTEAKWPELKDELFGLRERYAAFSGRVLTNAQICEREQVFRRIKEIKSELGCD